MWRRWGLWSALAVAVVIVVAAVVWVRTRPHPNPTVGVAGLDTVAEAPAGPSWAPSPTDAGGLRMLARASKDGFELSTGHGPVRFLPGVNLGSTTPGHEPGELSITAEQYRSWFAAMGRLGVRVVRVYTIHPPDFYDQLRRYNEAHRDAPLYLMQGVYLPDESYVHTQDLYGATPTAAFTQEMRDAVAAVHGSLERSVPNGRASGTWEADVSDWLVGWIVGVEWDPEATAASDKRNAGQPAVNGAYFTSTSDASPTERWLAARMNELATAEAERGRTVPVAFVNWPTTDPLRHPEEPLPKEDLVGVDANHIRATPAWPAGQFASYHAYPYYPDFQRHEPALATFQHGGTVDPYAGYLVALKAHHAQAGIPVLITEFGVPSSIGAAHVGPLSRDQGNHSEQEAMRIDAELLHLIKDLGLGAGLLFGWADEWFKFTWNTISHQIPAERRPLWHDELTNEQWFGLVAMDPTGAANPDEQTIDGVGGVETGTARVDEGFVRLDLTLREVADQPTTVALDTVPGLSGTPPPGSTDAAADVALVLNPSTHDGQLWIRAELDPIQLDYKLQPRYQPVPVNGWIPLRLITNRARVVPTTKQELPPEFLDVGRLRWGTWDPQAADYDGRSTWRVQDRTVSIRLPWAMAMLADPSSHRALVPSAPDHTVTIGGMGLTVATRGATAQLHAITWNDWNIVGYQVRLKAGAATFRDALVATTGA